MISIFKFGFSIITVIEFCVINDVPKSSADRSLSFTMSQT
jgi:hypothetical protein